MREGLVGKRVMAPFIDKEMKPDAFLGFLLYKVKRDEIIPC